MSVAEGLEELDGRAVEFRFVDCLMYYGIFSRSSKRRLQCRACGEYFPYRNNISKNRPKCRWCCIVSSNRRPIRSDLVYKHSLSDRGRFTRKSLHSTVHKMSHDSEDAWQQKALKDLEDFSVEEIECYQ